MDWAGLLRAGLIGLRLQPAQFWALTPAELMVMMGLDSGSAPMGRQRLMEMSRAYPDQTKGQQDGTG
jgi:uncharacterized phage protein (TIGR02216 family)